MAAEFKYYWGSNYLALPREPQPWIIEHFLPYGLTNVYGKPKTGKSWMVLGACLAISNPKVDTFLGKKVMKHGKVLYIQADTPRVEWAYRAQTLKQAGYDIEGIGFMDMNTIPYPCNVLIPEIKEGLKQTIKECTPLLVVIDTLREVHEGDEDKSKDMKMVITALIETTLETNTSLILLSHQRKGGFDDNDDDNIMDGNRGSNYVAGKMDMVMQLTPHTLRLQGRAIGKKKMTVEQDVIGLFQLNAEKSQSEANLMFVMGNPELKSERSQAELLASMEGIKFDAARSRIRERKKKIEEGGGVGG